MNDADNYISGLLSTENILIALILLVGAIISGIIIGDIVYRIVKKITVKASDRNFLELLKN
ncbi:MAG: hypothetical protein H0U27_04790 [Nitrosopumilus sp.]|nr:hypothetical protein [Nitrosopumilus sp.]